MGFLSSMFGGLTTENAGVALAEVGFVNAITSTRSIINFLHSSKLGLVDENRFGKIASFEFMFLNNHWINRESRALLAEPLRNEVNTFLMALQGLRIHTMLEAASDEEKNVAVGRFIQGQEDFDERFGKFPVRGPGEGAESGSLFYEFAKYLGRTIQLDRDALFLAYATGSAIQCVNSLKAREVLGKVRRSSA